MTIDFTRYLRRFLPTSLPISTPSTTTPAASDAILVGSCSTVPTRVTPLSDDAAGPRVVSSPVAGLVLGIAPVEAIDVLLRLPHFGAAAYACLTQATIDLPEIDLRAGESIDTPRRIAEHLALPPCPIEQILLLGSADPLFSPFGKDETLALQWTLHRLALRAGRAVVHGAAPQRPVLLDVEPARLARWGCDLRPMLQAAGIPHFEPQGRVIRPIVVGPKVPEAAGAAAGATVGDAVGDVAADTAALALSRGYLADLPAGLTERAGARRFVLCIREARARASVVGDLVVVHAGASVPATERSGVQACIVRKRRDMLDRGILQRTPGGVLRLTRDVALPTLTNAARTITGTNAPGACWIPAP